LDFDGRVRPTGARGAPEVDVVASDGAAGVVGDGVDGAGGELELDAGAEGDDARVDGEAAGADRSAGGGAVAGGGVVELELAGEVGGGSTMAERASPREGCRTMRSSTSATAAAAWVVDVVVGGLRAAWWASVPMSQARRRARAARAAQVSDQRAR
jgi:hypothetical protein